jgi:hypothetical protein
MVSTLTNVRRLRWRLVVVVSACFLASGCSSAPAAGPTPRIATLRSPDAVPASASANPEDLRPLIRMDTSPAEQDRLLQVYFRCLTAAYGTTDPYTKKWAFEREIAKDPKWLDAKAACHPKEPEEWQERLKRGDLAAFKANQYDFYKCAKNKGYKLTAMDDETGEFGLTEIGPNGDWGSAGIRDCERQAFTR